MLAPATIVTTTGRHISYHNAESERTTFLEVTEQDVLRTTAAVVAPSGKYVALLQHMPASAAVSETAVAAHDHTEQVAVYNVKLGKLASTITAPAGGNGTARIADFGFSEGLSKLLFIVWGSSLEPQLVLYRWYTSKAVCSVTSVDFARIACDPSSDRHLIGVAGPHAYRLEQDADKGSLSKRVLYTLAKARYPMFESKSFSRT